MNTTKCHENLMNRGEMVMTSVNQLNARLAAPSGLFVVLFSVYCGFAAFDAGHRCVSLRYPPL